MSITPAPCWKPNILTNLELFFKLINYIERIKGAITKEIGSAIRRKNVNIAAICTILKLSIK